MDKASDVYQKTAGAMGAVGEKASGLFGGIGAKFGALKENPTYKSFEERVGGVYTAARSKIPGGSSTQDFEEAFKEAEGESAAAAAAAAQEGGVAVDGAAPQAAAPVQQQQQQQPMS